MLSFLKRVLKKLFGYHSKEDLAKEYAKEIIYEIYKNTELIPKLRNHYEFFYKFLLKVSSSKQSIKKARDLIKDIESLISFYFSKHIKILEPKNLITVLEAYIANAKNIEELSFYKSLLNSDEVLSFPSPSLFFKFLFEFFVKNKEKLEFPEDLYKSLRVVKLLYQKTGIDQEIVSQRLILILTTLKLNKVISDNIRYRDSRDRDIRRFFLFRRKDAK